MSKAGDSDKNPHCCEIMAISIGDEHDLSLNKTSPRLMGIAKSTRLKMSKTNVDNKSAKISYEGYSDSDIDILSLL